MHSRTTLKATIVISKRSGSRYIQIGNQNTAVYVHIIVIPTAPELMHGGRD